MIKNRQIAKYSCDLRGGVNHICVYANGLSESMIVGDRLTSLLRVVSVSGKHSDIIENVYDSPIFNKVLPREISEIEIEIRTLEGRLVPFDKFAIVILTLIFKKIISF